MIFEVNFIQLTHKIKTKYLVFPVNTYPPKKELLFFEGEKQILELSIALDIKNPTFYANISTERFIGKQITFKTIPKMQISFIESDTPLYMPENEYLRPSLQFTASSRWTNDPNGLFKYKGEYHLFYQHNPADISWANMHCWGHAKSRDLVHWEELEEFLYPDENGQAYSGSAFVDKRNASGLKNGEDDPILIYYTASPRNDTRARSLTASL